MKCVPVLNSIEKFVGNIIATIDSSECNSFFVYGTLRDDLYRNRKNRGATKKSAWSVGASFVNLAIVYGYRMYGLDSFPYAVETNNTKHLSL